MAAQVTPRFTTLRTADEIVEAGLAAPLARDKIAAIAQRYAVAISPAMAALIDPAKTNDPIALQFVPSAQELETHPQETADPIGDGTKSPVAGLVHRYRDRVLLKVTGVCPVYCRFCFRREMVGPEFGRNLSAGEIDTGLAYIRAHPEIWEVILTGGDPFMLSPRRVGDITSRLSAIPHVKVLRWHTRVPVVAPETVTVELVDALRSGTAAVYVGLHANHPRELTTSARAAIARLVDRGIPLVSQSVLLKGVNDDADTLEALMRAFVEARVTPYYLHHGDLAPGTAHFRTTIAHGQTLMHELRRRLSGIAVPDYVLDSPGAHGKVSLMSANVRATADGYAITDRAGRVHIYREALSGTSGTV